MTARPRGSGSQVANPGPGVGGRRAGGRRPRLGPAPPRRGARRALPCALARGLLHLAAGTGPLRATPGPRGQSRARSCWRGSLQPRSSSVPGWGWRMRDPRACSSWPPPHPPGDNGWFREVFQLSRPEPGRGGARWKRVAVRRAQPRGSGRDAGSGTRAVPDRRGPVRGSLPF